MPIGTSKGAFYEDQFRAEVGDWFIDPKMEGIDKNVVDPKKLETDKEADAAEVDPTTGIGLEISGPDIDWSKLNQVYGSIKGTAPEDTPTVATAAGGIKITEGDIDQAINVGMGGGPGTLAGVGSKTAKAATGWFKGSDGKMRYEISDEGMRLADRDWRFGERGKLSEFVEHPELFKAYPELKDINFKVAPQGTSKAEIGGYNQQTKTLTINPAAVKAGDEGILDAMAHELQHVVQDVEGFARGSNPEYALKQALDSLAAKITEAKGNDKNPLIDLYFDIRGNYQKFANYMYLRAPGEVEANAVAARRKLTDAQRKAFPVDEMNRLLEGETNTLHGGKYVPEFHYPDLKASKEVPTQALEKVTQNDKSIAETFKTYGQRWANNDNAKPLNEHEQFIQAYDKLHEFGEKVLGKKGGWTEINVHKYNKMGEEMSKILGNEWTKVPFKP